MYARAAVCTVVRCSMPGAGGATSIRSPAMRCASISTAMSMRPETNSRAHPYAGCAGIAATVEPGRLTAQEYRPCLRDSGRSFHASGNGCGSGDAPWLDRTLAPCLGRGRSRALRTEGGRNRLHLALRACENWLRGLGRRPGGRAPSFDPGTAQPGHRGPQARPMRTGVSRYGGMRHLPIHLRIA